MSWGDAGGFGGGPCENPRSLSSPKAELNQTGVMAEKLKKGENGGLSGVRGEVHAKTQGPYQVPGLS